jgi:hypothetical protein
MPLSVIKLFPFVIPGVERGAKSYLELSEELTCHPGPPGVHRRAHLCDLLRMGRLPESYIASRSERELRELVRHRALCRYRHNRRSGYPFNRSSLGRWITFVPARTTQGRWAS